MRLIAAFVLVCTGFLAWPVAAADPVAAALKAGGVALLMMAVKRSPRRTA